MSRIKVKGKQCSAEQAEESGDFKPKRTESKKLYALNFNIFTKDFFFFFLNNFCCINKK